MKSIGLDCIRTELMEILSGIWVKKHLPMWSNIELSRVPVLESCFLKKGKSNPGLNMWSEKKAQRQNRMDFRWFCLSRLFALIYSWFLTSLQWECAIFHIIQLYFSYFLHTWFAHLKKAWLGIKISYKSCCETFMEGSFLIIKYRRNKGECLLVMWSWL